MNHAERPNPEYEKNIEQTVFLHLKKQDIFPVVQNYYSNIKDILERSANPEVAEMMNTDLAELLQDPEHISERASLPAHSKGYELLPKLDKNIVVSYARWYDALGNEKEKIFEQFYPEDPDLVRAKLEQYAELRNKIDEYLPNLLVSGKANEEQGEGIRVPEKEAFGALLEMAAVALNKIEEAQAENVWSKTTPKGKVGFKKSDKYILHSYGALFDEIATHDLWESKILAGLKQEEDSKRIGMLLEKAKFVPIFSEIVDKKQSTRVVESFKEHFKNYSDAKIYSSEVGSNSAQVTMERHDPKPFVDFLKNLRKQVENIETT